MDLGEYAFEISPHFTTADWDGQTRFEYPARAPNEPERGFCMVAKRDRFSSADDEIIEENDSAEIESSAHRTGCKESRGPRRELFRTRKCIQYILSNA